MSHTLGPWINRAYIIETVSGRKIGSVNPEFLHYGEPARSDIEREDDANASLIAAAPELLEACRKVVAAQSPEEYDEAREAAENAMLKAEGAQ